jgi:hypothetical protein
MPVVRVLVPSVAVNRFGAVSLDGGTGRWTFDE